GRGHTHDRAPNVRVRERPSREVHVLLRGPFTVRLDHDPPPGRHAIETVGALYDEVRLHVSEEWDGLLERGLGLLLAADTRTHDEIEGFVLMRRPA
ncbi:MAG: hypothetical protein Q7V53_05900, partial [Caldisericota bacterium]|nr:hypothetical protein [Caldisericota bacterium]